MFHTAPYGPILLEAGSARALPWTRIGDGEMFESVSLNAISTSSP